MPSEGRLPKIYTAPIASPSDVPAAAISSMIDRRGIHQARLADTVRPELGPATSADPISALALGVVISRQLEREQPHLVLHALRQGSSWSEIAMALDTTIAAAQASFAEWSQQLPSAERTMARELSTAAGASS
ncbi:hypothetical protein AB0O31_32890 [Kitasatospora cineracea]|uniref:hypothetical protein n=1 Tax=Kitasatospora cineracea TaxID=88074 RepID=UPI0034441350